MYFKEVINPRIGVEYWVVYNQNNETFHFFRNYNNAYEYSSWNNIPDILVYKECFNKFN